MSAYLWKLSETAHPTDFHRLLHTLDHGKTLLRVYTQNIDNLEEKVGLTYGIPDLGPLRPKRVTPSKAVAYESSRLRQDVSASIPRCIPLHGSLKHLTCQACTYTVPLRAHIDTLCSGVLPPCPMCVEMDVTRRLVGKRTRAVGRMRPDIVLYNEQHEDDNTIARLVQRDTAIGGSRRKSPPIDLLLVVGTSLRVSGAKNLVRQLAEAVHARPVQSPENADRAAPGLALPQTIYLNLDFRGSSSEWRGVFDMWIRGDAQVLAQRVHHARRQAMGERAHVGDI